MKVRRQRIGDFDERHYGEVLGLPTLVPMRGDELEVLQRTAGLALRMVECGLLNVLRHCAAALIENREPAFVAFQVYLLESERRLT